jgi:hypothetical protein
MTCHSNVLIKTRNELPNRIKKMQEPSEHLERRYTQANAAITESTKKLLKAQLQAGQHTLTQESFVGIAKKYGWQLLLLQSSWL